MISVWSPTFALQLLERLESMQQDVVEVLQSGKWGSRQASLKEVTEPHSPESAQALIASSNGEQIDFKKLWSKLSLVSSWDTAGSKAWAEKLKRNCPVFSLKVKAYGRRKV